jgi:hypothetical protein
LGVTHRSSGSGRRYPNAGMCRLVAPNRRFCGHPSPFNPGVPPRQGQSLCVPATIQKGRRTRLRCRCPSSFTPVWFCRLFQSHCDTSMEFRSTVPMVRISHVRLRRSGTLSLPAGDNRSAFGAAPNDEKVFVPTAQQDLFLWSRKSPSRNVRGESGLPASRASRSLILKEIE